MCIKGRTLPKDDEYRSFTTSEMIESKRGD